MIDRLRNTADQCRQEHRAPLAKLLDDASDRIERLESALKVIGTWASVEGALDVSHVREHVDKALKSR